SLAKTYQKQGRLDDTERLVKEVLEAQKLKLSHNHPDTLTTMHTLACMYQEQDRWEDAERVLKEVLEARKLKLGDEHPDTL
ncbi:hypothetical protein AMATHDRAFT_116245, partial [Amanita thiersii Skay4041]